MVLDKDRGECYNLGKVVTPRGCQLACAKAEMGVSSEPFNLIRIIPAKGVI